MLKALLLQVTSLGGELKIVADSLPSTAGVIKSRAMFSLTGECYAYVTLTHIIRIDRLHYVQKEDMYFCPGSLLSGI